MHSSFIMDNMYTIIWFLLAVKSSKFIKKNFIVGEKGTMRHLLKSPWEHRCQIRTC